MDKVEIRNDSLEVTAFVAPSRTKHLGEGWYVVGAPAAPKPPAPTPLRPGIEVENVVDAPQASSSPQGNTDTPEEKS